jgi:uncharacterized membrane protein YeaQ/YmgE (transglycosylase-associated protein family)
MYVCKLFHGSRVLGPRPDRQERVSLIGFIIAVVVSGLVVGALGRLALPGRDPMSIGMTILIGIGGSLIGGVVGRLLFGRDGSGLSMLLAVGGAALLVYIFRRTRGTRVG